MPIKRLRHASPARAACVCPPRKPMSFWLVFSFMVLFAAVFVIGSVTALLFQQQLNILGFLNAKGTANKVVFTPPMLQTPECQYKETQVVGVHLAYQPCKPMFTGACDDAGLYRLAADGSKQVIISSLRNLPGAPLSNELLQPIEQGVGGQFMVFGAWAFGSNRNPNDRRIWLYDMQTGSLVAKAEVPSGAVYSPDFMYAAYAGKDENGDLRDIMIVNLKENKTVSGAKAEASMTFQGPDGKASLRWQDAKNLYIKQYTRGDMKNPVPVEDGEIHVKVK